MFGKTGGTRNIHASLWGPGVTSSKEASNYTNTLILDLIESSTGLSPKILDLGCGTGATLAYLQDHGHPNTELVGVTLSQHQADRAKAIFSNNHSCISVQAADYHHLPKTWHARFDLAFAIESFVHSSQPQLFFEEAHRVLQPGGTLVLIDTFPVKEASSNHFKYANEVSDYQVFWNAGQVLDPDQLGQLAARTGFKIISNEDLTPFVEKDRIRDRWIARFNRRFHRLTTLHPYLHALRGGNAVQSGFRHGWLTYRKIVFQQIPSI